MSRDKRVHVGLQPEVRVDALLVEFDFYEAVGVRADDEVDFRPIDHDHLLEVVDNIG